MKLQEQVAAVMNGRIDYEEAHAYYEGDVPESFATAKVRRALRVSGEAGGLNFCRTVVDSVNDRLEIAAVVGENDEDQQAIGELWSANELALEISDIHRAALEYGDTYVIVWPDADGKLQVSHNSPLTTALVYDKENPRAKSYAVKVWVDGNQTRMNLFTADTVTKLIADGDTISEHTEWRVIEVIDNPFAEVPVFHFRTHRPFGRPEHKDAYNAQNAITKHFVNSLVVADYQAAPQRYALSKMGEDSGIPDHDATDTDRENVGSLKNGPGELWYLLGIDKVGQFEPADPDAFWTPIEKSVQAMASITNTPLHYFDNSGSNISGESLRVAEAPLLKKVKDRRNSFGATWRELFTFMLRQVGITTDVQVKWIEVESLDELERWDVTLKKINAGLSHRQALRENGYDEAIIEKIMAERQMEQEEGSYYQRVPEARVSLDNDETNAVETITA